VRTDLKLVYVTTSRPLDVVPDAGKAAISAPLVSHYLSGSRQRARSRKRNRQEIKLLLSGTRRTQPRRRADEFFCSTLGFLVVMYGGFINDKRLLM